MTRIIKPLVEDGKADTLIGEFLNRFHYHELLTHDAAFFHPETGKLVAMLVKRCLSPDRYLAAYEGLRTVSDVPNNRGLAVAGRGP